MLRRLLDTSQYIWEMIAGTTSQDVVKKTKKWDTKSKTIEPSITPTNAFRYFQIRPLRENEFGVNHWDTILRNLVSIKDEEIVFWITWNNSDSKLYVRVPRTITNYFINTFYANYPTSNITEVDFAPIRSGQSYIEYEKSDTVLTKQDFTKDWSYMDPMNDIFALLQNIPKEWTLSIYFSYTFIKHPSLLSKLWQWTVFLVNKIRWNSPDELSKKEQEEEDANKPRIYLSIGYAMRDIEQDVRNPLRSDIISAFSPFSGSGKITIKEQPVYNHFTFGQVVNFFHLPTMTNFVKWLSYISYKKLPYPTNLPTTDTGGNEEMTLLGTTDYRAESIEFGIKKEDKLRHVYVVGKTGTGKSTLISNMIKHDMQSNHGLALLDPHGDLVDTVIEHIPNHRINDVVLFDVADTSYPIGFNLLQYETEEEKNRIVSGVVSTFYKLYAHSRWPRLEYILRNVLLSIVEYPNATLMHILRILVDEWFRKEVISHITDPLVIKFWQNEFNKWNDKQREEAIAPITNKIWQFLSSSVVRNIFGQPRSKLNMRKAMDEGKIILVNLSKGKIGEDNASMIGSLLVTKFQIDAMSRADVNYNARKDFYLYIDEFQNFATDSFATILSEARKYKLSLIVANQYTSQLNETIRDAIFGNIGTIISFTLGHDDASVVSAQFKWIVSTNDLISLPRFTTYTKLMIDGITSDPFSVKTMPLDSPENSVELKEKILKQSRQRYAIERWELEKLMNAWNSKTFSAQEKVVEKAHYESLGLSESEVENLQHPYISNNIILFEQYRVNDQSPDALIFDTKNWKHKAIFYSKPAWLDSDSYYQKDIGTIALYHHGSLKDERNEPLTVLVGDKDAIVRMSNMVPYLLFAPNVNRMKAEDKKSSTEKSSIPKRRTPNKTTKEPTNSHTWTFSIDDITLGNEYVGYVKLIYNYGIFVTVKGVEWLLHKKMIDAPDTVEWKKYYNIWDKIKVKAKEFKTIKWEKKVVWSQK